MPTEKHQQRDLPQTGYVRLKTVLAVYPVGRSTWYRGIAEGRFPKPILLSARTKGYAVDDIRKLIEMEVAR
jgi:predicted DNA-binding transcriptional regulator AlpA